MQRVALISDSRKLHQRLTSALCSDAAVDRLQPNLPNLPRELGRLKPSLLLFDLDAGRDVSVREVVEAAVGADVRLEVVAVGDAANANDVIQALRAGSVDFLDREDDEDKLRKQIVSRLQASPAQGRGEPGEFSVVIGAQPGGGASPFSVNLALLKSRPASEGLLIDCTLPATEAGAALGLAPTYTLWDASRDVERLDRTLLIAALATHAPSGLRLMPLAARATDEASVSPENFLKVLATIRPLFRETVLNVGGVRHPRLLASILAGAGRIYLVCPQVLTAVRDAKDLLASLPPELDFRARTLLVVDEYDSEIALTDAQIRKALGFQRSVRMPQARAELVNSLNLGKPLLLEDPQSPYVTALAAAVGAEVDPEISSGGSSWGRLTSQVFTALRGAR